MTTRVPAADDHERALLEGPDARALARLVEAATDVVVRFDRELRHVYANPAIERVTGRTREEFLGRTNRELGMPEDLCDLWERELAVAFETGRSHSFAFEFPTPRGPRSFDARVEPEPGPDGTVQHVISITRDVSDAREAEARIAFQASLLDQVRNAVVATDMEGAITYWNAAAEELYGWSREEALGRQVLDVTVPVEGAALAAEILEAIEARGHWEGEFEVRRRDGTTFVAQVFDTLVRDAEGAPVGVVGVSSDLSERKATERALQESEELFRQLSEHIDAALWLSDPVVHGLRYVSPAYERIWGRSAADLLADPSKLADSIHPEDRARVLPSIESVRVEPFQNEYRVVRPDGSIVWVHDSGFPIRGADGSVERIVGLAVDVTAQRRLEQELRQAQKLEAIGILSGGIAHDFNNLLTAINGYSDLVLGALERGDTVRATHGLEEIRRAGERAAELTQQLLALSRRQVLRPEALDLNEVVLEYVTLLERQLGEGLAVRAALAAGPCFARVDRGQLGQVLINLAVNARDAMEPGGELAIATGTVSLDPAGAALVGGLEAGDYAVLTVSDTGAGMDAETRARAFDPFFTTKEQGRGLGLPTVLGVVQQSGGTVTLESEPGAGSTVRVYLPRGEAGPERPAGDAPLGRGRGETVLLVEDEGVVRELVQELLGDAGYEIVAAAAPDEALALLRAGLEPDLLVTDVVMPQMNGRELAALVLEQRPGLPVLYTSGYTGEVVAERGILGPEDEFLQKPFSGLELARRVRALLDARERAG